MRTVVFLALAELSVACGGRIAAVGQGDGTSGATPPVIDAAAVIDAAPGVDASAADAGHDALGDAHDANPDIQCVPTTPSDNGCPPPAYCLLFIATDATVFTVAGDDFSSVFPDADIVSSHCETVQAHPLATACDGGLPLAAGIIIDRNQVGWAVCRAP